MKQNIGDKTQTRNIISSLLIVIVTGCVTQHAYQPQTKFENSKYHDLQIEKCIDRSGHQGSHPNAEEASQALIEKITDSGLFKITANAKLLMTCDIDKFSEGSALKRWLMPGWGVTRAEISVMIWKKDDSSVLATFKSQSEVGSGGLYSIGAEHYNFIGLP